MKGKIRFVKTLFFERGNPIPTIFKMLKEKHILRLTHNFPCGIGLSKEQKIFFGNIALFPESQCLKSTLFRACNVTTLNCVTLLPFKCRCHVKSKFFVSLKTTTLNYGTILHFNYFSFSRYNSRNIHLLSSILMKNANKTPPSSFLSISCYCPQM